MPNMSGLEFLEKVKKLLPRSEVAVMTGHGSVETAVQAMKLGAYDYIGKPFSPLEELRLFLRRMAEKVHLVEENQFLRERVDTESDLHGIVGSSAKIQDVLRMISRLKDTRTPVLISGESGTGKELVARAIHFRGSFANRPFVAVDCGSLVPTLIESELFGYEKGAFTGAAQQRKGKFELASGGTLFLDEIGDMNPVTQAKVLRALESRQIERLGGLHPINVDVRVVSATHRNLPAEIAASRFREDLYYRIRVVTLELPPLRAHKEDIPLLAATFLEQFGARHHRQARLIPEAMELLRRYKWPGNIRELRNALERTLVLSEGTEIRATDLPEEIRLGTGEIASRDGAAFSFLGESDFREAKRQFEVAYFKRKLEEHHWNVSQTAAEVGLHRQSLQEKLRELGIQRPGK
jgi:DNA-binding NtrC family response regulator